MSDSRADFENIMYFLPEEFDSPDRQGSGREMKQALVARLDVARRIASIPFRINSGFRTPAHNAKVGGKPSSAHLRGYAADIACEYSVQRHAILSALMQAGFDRIGIAGTFIHVDCDPSLTPGVIWTY